MRCFGISVFLLVLTACSLSVPETPSEQHILLVPAESPTPLVVTALPSTSTPPLPLPFPQPGDEKLSEAPAYIEGVSWEGTFTRPLLRIWGNLPTPCHQLRLQSTGPDAQGAVHLRLYAVIAPQTECIEVLAPFEVRVPLPPGFRQKDQVFINGVPLSTLLATPTADIQR